MEVMLSTVALTACRSVEVPATVLKRLPPVSVSPLEERNPADAIPPLKVEVAVDDATLMMPQNELEALSESMAKIGVEEAREEVAMVNAYLALLGIVVVAIEL